MSRHIHILLSAPGLFGFMSGQTERLRQLGFATTVISAPSEWLDERVAAEGAARRILPICREISPWRDAVTFLRLCRLFRHEAPEAVLLSGPKAIFLGGMAAWLCDVPTRVVVYHGMRQENLRGPLRWILDLCDRISFACASQVLAVSPSLSELVVARGLVPAGQVSVVGQGTANGVDPVRFALEPEGIARAVQLKQALGIPREAPVIGFIGRLTEDKGVADAYAAYQTLRSRHPGLHLLLIGQDEMHTPTGRDLLARMRADGQVRLVDHTDAVEDYLHIIWAQVFPSAREGFGMVIAEAAALAVPTAAYAVTGVRDAIVDGETGLLARHGDVDALASALACYLEDAGLRRHHGLGGWSRVRQLYTPRHTWPSYLSALGFEALAEPIGPGQTMSAAEAAAFEERERLLR